MMFSQRQQQILDESINLIDKKGIQGFTIKNLSKEVGISEPAIYRHFESKFDILCGILDSFKLKISENQKFLRDNHKDTDPVVKLKMFTDQVFSIFEENPSLITVIFSEEIFLNEHQLSDRVNSIQSLNEDLIRSVLRELPGKSQAAFDIDSFILIYFGSIRLLARKWKISNYSFDLKKRGNKLMITLFKLLN